MQIKINPRELPRLKTLKSLFPKTRKNISPQPSPNQEKGKINNGHLKIKRDTMAKVTIGELLALPSLDSLRPPEGKALRKIRVGKKIYLLIFRRKEDMNLWLLRITEYRESHPFRGKIFSYGEYEQRYSIKEYIAKWNGHNFPLSTLLLFFNKNFGPLDPGETKVLKLFEKENREGLVEKENREGLDGYVIATHVGGDSELLKHELAHALYYLDEIYQAVVRELLQQYDLTALRNRLLQEGYNKESADEDEPQAYILDSCKKASVQIPREDIPLKLKEKITKAFWEAVERYPQT
jgi:hypothetical protein